MTQTNAVHGASTETSEDAEQAAVARKLVVLRGILRQVGSVLVAYSGGVDSSVLYAVAHDVLGPAALAVTAVSASTPPYEVEQAVNTARLIGGVHLLVESSELADPRYVANPPDRCYYCKTHLSEQLQEIARQRGVACVVDGNNADDVSDDRPGRVAAQERGVRSPLLEAGLTKLEIRRMARHLGLPNWDKPSAPCLASRVPYGSPITVEKLEQVARAEAALRALGCRVFRVRHHGAVARLEIAADERDLVLSQRHSVVQGVKAAGFRFVALDLEDFRSGNMNTSEAARGS